MKWFLSLLLLGAGYVAYTQSQEVDRLNATVAELKRQLQASTPTRTTATAAAPAMPYYPPTPAPRPSWMNTGSDLDKTPGPAHRTR